MISSYVPVLRRCSPRASSLSRFVAASRISLSPECKSTNLIQSHNLCDLYKTKAKLDPFSTEKSHGLLAGSRVSLFPGYKRTHQLQSHSITFYKTKAKPDPFSVEKLSTPSSSHFLLTGSSVSILPKHEINRKEKSDSSSTEKDSSANWAILRRWSVPWDWQTVLLTMVTCPVCVVLPGLVEGPALSYLSAQGANLSSDEHTVLHFAWEFIGWVMAFGVVCRITRTFQPLPDGLFCYEWKRPFNLRNGWLLWAGIGFMGEIIALSLVTLAFLYFNPTPPQRKNDDFVSWEPIVRSSVISTVCLAGTVGVLGPVLEEILFRGFLLASLTKWFSTPASVLVSAAGLLWGFHMLRPEIF